MTTKLRNLRLSWPAILLFTALLAQAPHAAAVFIRIAPHDAQWEVWTSFVGAWVYAIALEGATAYFVWRSKLRWAIAFAAFSIAHNVAYYMPGAWTVNVFGATLTISYIFSALLISMSLPIAIAAFSHVQAEDRQKAPRDTNTHPTHPETPVALPSAILGHSEHTAPEDTNHAVSPDPVSATAAQTQSAPQPSAKRVRKAARVSKHGKKPTPAQRQAQIHGSGISDAATIAAQFGVSLRTAQNDIIAVRKATMQTNGASHG